MKNPFTKNPPEGGIEVTALDLCKPEYQGRPILPLFDDGDPAWRQARQNLGRTPEVASCEYKPRGEGGEPTVYLVLTGWRKPRTYCLKPEHVVRLEG